MLGLLVALSLSATPSLLDKMDAGMRASEVEKLNKSMANSKAAIERASPENLENIRRTGGKQSEYKIYSAKQSAEQAKISLVRINICLRWYQGEITSGTCTDAFEVAQENLDLAKKNKQPTAELEAKVATAKNELDVVLGVERHVAQMLADKIKADADAAVEAAAKKARAEAREKASPPPASDPDM